jgi:hypothetical protein
VNGPLTGIDIRIIVEKDSNVVSGGNAGVAFFGVRDSFVKDITGDGKQEYVFIGEDNYQHIRIWRIAADCTVVPIRFREGGDTVESVPGREIVLEPSRSHNDYAIHTRLSAPTVENGKDVWEVDEKVYSWDKQDLVFKLVKNSTWFKRAD